MCQREFSLLELLIVLAIMVTTATISLSVFEDSDIELRYQRTVTRLKDIERALLGDKNLVTEGQRQLSGYVVDMGHPAGNIEMLYRQPDTFSSWSPEYPIGSGNVLGQIQLQKGHRGNYLSSLPGSDEFRDGWGMPGLGDGNYGWDLSWGAADVAAHNVISGNVKSLGADANLGGAMYDKDLELKIDKSDWSCNILNMQVEIHDPNRYIEKNHLADQNRICMKLLCYNGGDPLHTVKSQAATFNSSDNIYRLIFTGNLVYMGEHAMVLTHGASDNILKDRHQNPIFKYQDFIHGPRRRKRSS